MQDITRDVILLLLGSFLALFGSIFFKLTEYFIFNRIDSRKRRKVLMEKLLRKSKN